ncbi:hypothetical protein M5K25_024925 [Dendrobium thyrsiflorum]|uniref:Uncharacterized protein n=1 Tax=Dendrobium thyrsiflorum TaxID=117978 RepID=A0ABD0U3E3_DENTH
MDSLLANYASSDDDGEAEEVSRAIPRPKLSSLSNALPPPKSSSFFSSPPPPRISNSSSPSSSSSLETPNQPQSSSIFSTLPPPKTSSSSTFSSLPAPKSLSGNSSNKPSSDPKRVVHFTLPLNPSILKSLDPDDDEEEEKGRKVRKDTSSSSTPKALSSMLPAPKNSLCIAPAPSFGASRRSSLQTDDPSANCPQGSKTEHEVGSFASYSEYGAEQGMAVGYEACGSYSAEQGFNDYENYKNDDGNWSSGVVNPAAVSSVDATYASPARIGWEQENANSFGYRSYMDGWSNVSSGATTSEIPDIGRIAGKRGRTDIPTEIVEVKQDELMKNRPRDDQIKSTGIAFGPAYQKFSFLLPFPSVNLGYILSFQMSFNGFVNLLLSRNIFKIQVDKKMDVLQLLSLTLKEELEVSIIRSSNRANSIKENGYLSRFSSYLPVSFLSPAMADPGIDHGFVYNAKGQVDILQSPFFDLTSDVDHSVEEYVDRNIFQLAATIDEQISSVQWTISSKIKKAPDDNSLPSLKSSTKISNSHSSGDECRFLSPASSPAMVDPRIDHGFVYNAKGQVDILQSPFFDFTPDVDHFVEEYVDRIIFQLAATIEKQISSVQWTISSKIKKAPDDNSLPSLKSSTKISNSHSSGDEAAPSGKGKPSKLHKRKHQIGSLYYDLKQKEMELAERRSKGLLTKAETQAKYGW